MSQSKAKIIAVAIRSEGKIWSLPAPSRHCDVFRLMRDEGFQGPWKGDLHYDQGFLDEDGIYLHRHAAKVQAFRSGQITSTISKVLTSEDLW